MSTSSRQPRHLATSPFAPKLERPIETFEVSDLVSHDSYGLGRVVSVEPAAVSVDFTSRTVRIPSPFSKMTRL
ncbi:hypothetical protein ABLE68_17345 [Nocardioides sp. CN2-186]|uniref:hypothetical protein n=1 Tax=Nocardioides tweenelious TaxID=3156607 RepID=UPI0032B40A03